MGQSKLQMRLEELSKARPILSTVHGSHLYGLAHEDSDYDTYEVMLGCDKRFAWNRNEDTDTTHIHLSRFQQAVTEGAPQALEALYSPLAEVHPHWQAFFAGMRPGIDNARATYRRAILNFGLHNGGRTGAAAEPTDPFKLRRHALRLTYNLDELVRTGRFNPRLTPSDAVAIKANATMSDSHFERLLTSSLENALLGRIRQMRVNVPPDSPDKVIFVGPYIKGPEGKPLMKAPKVQAVVR